MAGLIEKVRLEQSFEGGKVISQEDIWEKERGRFTLKLVKWIFKIPKFQGVLPGRVYKFVFMIP